MKAQYIKCDYKGKNLLVPKQGPVNIDSLLKDLDKIYTNIEKASSFLMFEDCYIDPLNHIEYFSSMPLKSIQKCQQPPNRKSEEKHKKNKQEKSKRNKYVYQQNGMGYRIQSYKYYDQDFPSSLSLNSSRQFDQATKQWEKSKKSQKVEKITQKQAKMKDSPRSNPQRQYKQQDKSPKSENSKLLKMLFQSSLQELSQSANQEAQEAKVVVEIKIPEIINTQQPKQCEESFSLIYPKQYFDCFQQNGSQLTNEVKSKNQKKQQKQQTEAKKSTKFEAQIKQVSQPTEQNQKILSIISQLSPQMTRKLYQNFKQIYTNRTKTLKNEQSSEKNNNSQCKKQINQQSNHDSKDI